MARICECDIGYLISIKTKKYIHRLSNCQLLKRLLFNMEVIFAVSLVQNPMNAPCTMYCCVILKLCAVAYVNHFKVVLLMWVVAINGVGGYFLGKVGNMLDGELSTLVQVWRGSVYGRVYG